MHSIQFKTTAITIAAILTTILAVFAACFSTVRNETDRSSVETMNLIAQTTQKSIEKYFESIEQSVEMAANLAGDTLDSVILAESGAIGEHMGEIERSAEQTAALNAYLAEYCEGIQEAFESVASRTHGIVTYYYCINPEISTEQHGFFYSRVGKTGFVEQPPLDARTLDPDDTEHTTWYYTPIQRGRPSWVGPYTAHFLDEMWISSYLVPIYKAGTLIGVLGMDIPVETIVEQVSSIRVYNTGYACLFEADGCVLYHPALESGTMADKLELSVHSEVFENERSGDAPIRYLANGEKRQLAFATLSNGMKLVVTAPTREIESSWMKLVRTVLLVTAAVTAVFAVIVMLAMRLLARPLVRLTSASRKLAAEDYDVALEYKSHDEVGELTEAFKQMRDRMKSHIDDLNRQVSTDTLTGLSNMRYFFSRAEEQREKLRAQGSITALLYFDLIGMKHFNRQYGFDEGDRLLCSIGDILIARYGEQFVCRLGDDHFAAVTDSADLEEKLQALFRECEGANNGRSLPIRVGIYRGDLEHVSVSVACDRAKYACDLHRGSYESGFYYFDRSMIRRFELVRYVNTHLDQALAERWIQVYYQPIIRAANGMICDDESLARWIDPEAGMLSPADFIPFLEDSGQIYKLDLYVLDQVLEKQRMMKASGYPVIPHSINLSRSDFEACDIVEEIRRRVDDAGLPRKLIAVEVTESMIGSDFDSMKTQIERFRALGFPVWLDDFGSGYSSLDVLQSIRFDLVKFDMSFMRKLDEGESSRIVLTEMMKLVTSLRLDTVCEGVETQRQLQFLQEIGCSKIQGFYFGKPLPLSEVLERVRNPRIGYENPGEVSYYEAIGKVNLYDLSMIGAQAEDGLQNFFNTLPMGIIEVRGDKTRFVRSNQSYRDFVKRFVGFDLSREGTDFVPISDPFVNNIVKNCCEQGAVALFDQQMENGALVHSIARRIAVNPVNGTVAVVVAVLSITDAHDGATYASIARALAADYYNIYYIDLDTEQFIEYSSPVGADELAVERHGEQFFAAVKRDAALRIYAEDRETFLRTFTKENIVRELDEQGVFTTTYRLIDTGVPMYVNMKITRMLPERNRLIMGVSIIDSQMKQKEENNKARMERIALGRIVALSGNYIVIYSIEPETGRYVEFSASEDYSSFELAKEGEDFFRQVKINSPKAVVPEDLPFYSSAFTEENVLREIKRNGLFAINYRLNLNGTVTPVCLRAAIVRESDGEKLIVGIQRAES